MKQKKHIREKVSNVLNDIKLIRTCGVMWFVSRHEILVPSSLAILVSVISNLVRLQGH